MIATHQSALEPLQTATRALNLLAIDEWIPYPPDSGKRVRTWNLLRRLAHRHRITLVCYGETESAAAKAVCSTGIRVHTVAPVANGAPWRLYPRLAANLFSHYPYSVAKHYTTRFEERLRSLLSTQHFDLVHCEWTPYARFLPVVGEIPTLVMAHNIESQIWSRRAQQSPTLIRRAFFALQARRMESFEREVLTRAGCVAAVTPLDAEQLRAWGVQNVSLVENGVDLDEFSPSSPTPLPQGGEGNDSVLGGGLQGQLKADSLLRYTPPRMTATPKCHPEQSEGSAFLLDLRNHDTQPGRILFFGSLDWYPNLDALDYLLKEIMPPIAQRLPSVKLQVVGKAPPQGLAMRLAGGAGVEFVGEVPDVRPYLAQAAVVVVPLRIGGGSRIKILEALAMGKAVVSTSIGAEGLAVSDGIHLLLADTPAEFASRTVELLTSPQECRRLGENGRRLVVERYSWDRAAEALESAWEQVSGVRC